MASIVGLSSRDRVLSNSAAEFLETRGDVAMGPDIAGTSPEFVPELDRFRSREDVFNVDYHEQSRERLEQFKRTLTAFQQNLIDRKVDTRFDISIKDAQDYTLDDVLQIANMVQQRNKKLDNVNRCTKGIKKFFRAAGRNASTFKKLLAFVPSDAYGSVICGGFTVILEALERTESLQDKMCDTLEKIPLTLRKLHNWLDVHHKSVRLKFRADAVLVAIFVLLELIIRELSGSTSKKFIKVPFKGEAYGSNIDEAITALEESVSDFEEEARICGEQRLGEIDAATRTTLMTTRQLDERARDTDLTVQKLSQDLAGIENRFATQLRLDHASIEEKLAGSTEKVLGKLEKKEKKLTAEAHGVQVHNVFYCFLTSNPSVDSKTGLLDPFQAERKLLQATMPVSTHSETSTSYRSSTPVLGPPLIPKDWEKAYRRVRKIVVGDLVDCFQDMRFKPDLAEKNRIAFILVSEQVRAYLRSTVSRLLVVELPCGGDGYFTPASYASTVLIRAVQKIGTFPVLYHFCVSRGTDPNPKNDLLAGGRGILTSLLSQLLEHLEYSRGIDLDFLSTRRNRANNVIDDSDRLLFIMEELLRRVPESICIYIVIDGVWKLQNDDDQDVLDGLLGLGRDEDVFVKILVTSPLSLDILDPLATEEAKQRKRVKKAKVTVSPESKFLILHVPEHVDHGHHDFNTSWVEEEMNEVLRECPGSSRVSSGPELRPKSKRNEKSSKKKRTEDISSESDTSNSDSDDTADSGYACGGYIRS